MNYRYYTTTTKKEVIEPSSVKWIINQLSQVEEQLKNKQLRKLNYTLRSDLKQVLGELNITINQLLNGVQ